MPKRKWVRLAAIVGMLATIAIVSTLGIAAYECNANGIFCGFGLTNRFPSEAIALDHYSFQIGQGQQFPTILTLWINNIGKSTVSLQSVSVRNSTGGSYFTTIANSIGPGAIANVTIDTSSSEFHFDSGQSYAVSLTTSRYNYGFTLNYT